MPDETKILLRGSRFNVESVAWETPNGERVERELVSHPGSVVILPITSNEEVILIRNDRYAVQKILWELPAGTLAPREAPSDCATRELTEETGFSAGRMIPLASFLAVPGWCNERMHCFVATELTAGMQKLEAGEQITVEPRKWPQVLAMIQDGTIEDCKTVSTLLYYRLFINDLET